MFEELPSDGRQELHRLDDRRVPKLLMHVSGRMITMYRLVVANPAVYSQRAFCGGAPMVFLDHPDYLGGNPDGQAAEDESFGGFSGRDAVSGERIRNADLMGG